MEALSFPTRSPLFWLGGCLARRPAPRPPRPLFFLSNYPNGLHKERHMWGRKPPGVISGALGEGKMGPRMSPWIGFSWPSLRAFRGTSTHSLENQRKKWRAVGASARGWSSSSRSRIVTRRQAGESRKKRTLGRQPPLAGRDSAISIRCLPRASESCGSRPRLRPADNAGARPGAVVTWSHKGPRTAPPGNHGACEKPRKRVQTAATGAPSDGGLRQMNDGALCAVWMHECPLARSDTVDRPMNLHDPPDHQSCEGRGRRTGTAARKRRAGRKAFPDAGARVASASGPRVDGVSLSSTREARQPR